MQPAAPHLPAWLLQVFRPPGGASVHAVVVQAAARVQLEKVDCLLVPTALHHYTVKEVEAEERPADQDGKPAQVESVPWPTKELACVVI